MLLCCFDVVVAADVVDAADVVVVVVVGVMVFAVDVVCVVDVVNIVVRVVGVGFLLLRLMLLWLLLLLSRLWLLLLAALPLVDTTDCTADEAADEDGDAAVDVCVGFVVDADDVATDAAGAHAAPFDVVLDVDHVAPPDGTAACMHVMKSGVCVIRLHSNITGLAHSTRKRTWC